MPLSFVACDPIEDPKDDTEQEEQTPGNNDQKPEEETPASKTELVVSKKGMYLEAKEATSSFTVKAGAAWTISTDAEWLTIDPMTGIITGQEVTINVTAEDNTRPDVRQATITVKAGEGDKAAEHKISVSQAGSPVDPEAELARKQNIPHIYINVNGQQIKDKKTYIKGTVTIKDPEKLFSDEAEQVLEMTKDGIRGRGNSTWDWPKKPYKLKFDSKVSILGFPKDKEWCLLANYSDRTLLRNITAMRLSEICGFGWTPRMRTVEVTLDGKYLGVYNFSEHKKVSSDRVNIEVAEGAETEGGYYFELDERSVGEETYCWETALDIPVLVAEPEEPTAAQYSYVKQYFSDFETALKNGDYSESTGYRKYIDVKSFIDYYIVQELTKNVDGNLRLSSFLTKEKGKKLEMYHLWDFDLTMGNCGYFSSSVGNGPENFYIKDCGWFKYLFKDPKFVDELQARWNELYPKFQEIPAFIQNEAVVIEKARIRNFQTWDITKNDIGWVKMPNKGSYEAELQYLLDFYTARLAWLNRELKKL